MPDRSTSWRLRLHRQQSGSRPSSRSPRSAPSSNRIAPDWPEFVARLRSWERPNCWSISSAFLAVSDFFRGESVADDLGKLVLDGRLNLHNVLGRINGGGGKSSVVFFNTSLETARYAVAQAFLLANARPQAALFIPADHQVRNHQRQVIRISWVIATGEIMAKFALALSGVSMV